MLRYSYKVELKKLEIKQKAFHIALLQNPKDEKIKKRLDSVNNSIKWYKEKIKNGEDPGTIIL